jgi:hypothetical protein
MPRSYQVTPAVLGSGGRHNHRRSDQKADTRLKSQPAADPRNYRLGRTPPPDPINSLTELRLNRDRRSEPTNAASLPTADDHCLA